MPSDHPCKVENVYAIDAIVLPAVFRIDKARGARGVCDFREVSK
jgi:hypothetical protein